MGHDTYETYLSILNRELVCALGCTEPIAVAYVAALAREALGAMPEHIDVVCSGNIIKNVKSVSVPNSDGKRGIEAAAALGAVGGDACRALEVLESVDEVARRQAECLVNNGFCSVSLAEQVPNLYVRVHVRAAGHEACACVAGRHTNVVELTRDGMPVSVCGISAEEHDCCDTASAEDSPELELLSLEGI